MLSLIRVLNNPSFYTHVNQLCRLVDVSMLMSRSISTYRIPGARISRPYGYFPKPKTTSLIVILYQVTLFVLS